MKRKRLDRDAWGFQGFPYYQMHMDHELFHGIVGVLHLVSGEYQYWEMPKAGKIGIVGEGMTWLQLIPDGQSRVITAMMKKNKEISVWYVDVIDHMEFDQDGVAVFIDKYLDVIFSPQGDMKIDDRDELDAAYETGELSKKQYESALLESEEIVNEYVTDTQKTEKWCRKILDYVEEQIKSGLSEFKKKQYLIETERLRLRELSADDFFSWHRILSDEETMQYYPKPFDEEKTKSWLDWNFENYRKYGFGLWAVTLKETGEMIGDCGFTMQNIHGEIKPELGYHINKEYWRKGYATEAARGCLKWFFSHTDFDEVFNYQKYTNLPSRGVARKVGMTFREEYESTVNQKTSVHSITRAEFKKQEATLL